MSNDIRCRTIDRTDPAKCVRSAETMSGIEFLSAMRDGSLEEPPIGRLIGLRLTEVKEGRVALEFTPAECHYNPSGRVHGGVTALLIDAATGSAVYSLLPAGVKYTSLDLKVNFVRSIALDAGPLRCEAWVVHMGATTGLAEARLTDGQGRLYAVGASTCMIFR